MAKIVAVYVFLLFCRILEFLPVMGLERLRLMLLVTAVALVVVFVTGNLIGALKTPLGLLLIAWTAWMVVCMPFSNWRSETLNQFLNSWLKSLMVFFIAAGLAASVFAFRKVMSAMGWAAAAACLLVLPGLAASGNGNGVTDRLLGIGSLSNPNEIAFHLWLGLPFLILLAMRKRLPGKYFLFGVCGFELVLILKTVSREGVLLALVVFLLALLRFTAANKAKLILGAFALCLAAVFILSQSSLDRYLTLVTSNVSGDAASSAAASSRMRQQKLMESIELTLRHPIFGVGMGVFMPASVEIAKERGTRGDWEVSHNSYTQVSSELGFPGILLLLAICAVAYRQLFRIDRAAKRLQQEAVRQMAFVLGTALTVLCVHFCFDSMAYGFYMPLVTGLVAAFATTYRPLLTEQATEGARQRSTVLPGHPVANSPNREPASSDRNLQPARANPQLAAPKNPYRFGRRRR